MARFEFERSAPFGFFFPLALPQRPPSPSPWPSLLTRPRALNTADTHTHRHTSRSSPQLQHTHTHLHTPLFLTEALRDSSPPSPPPSPSLFSARPATAAGPVPFLPPSPNYLLWVALMAVSFSSSLARAHSHIQSKAHIVSTQTDRQRTANAAAQTDAASPLPRASTHSNVATPCIVSMHQRPHPPSLLTRTLIHAVFGVRVCSSGDARGDARLWGWMLFAPLTRPS